MNYIDGFAFPIRNDKLDDYLEVVEIVAEIWKEHGALDYREFVADDIDRQGVMPFPKLFSTNEDETIIFGWVTFESKESRDEVNEKVESDPRMHEIVAPLVEGKEPVFEPHADGIRWIQEIGLTGEVSR